MPTALLWSLGRLQICFVYLCSFVDNTCLWNEELCLVEMDRLCSLSV